MKKNLMIIGASTPTIIRIIDDINKYSDDEINVIGFIDNDETKHGEKFMSHDIFGSEEVIKKFDVSSISLINTVAGSLSARRETTEFFLGHGYEFTNIIHPGVNINYVTLGEGLYVQENALLQAKSIISDHVIVSSNACVAHDSYVGKYSFIGPAVYVCGRVTMQNSCYLGVGAKILPNLNIGNDVVIAAGSIVTKDIKDGLRIRGIPARPF